MATAQDVEPTGRVGRLMKRRRVLTSDPLSGAAPDGEAQRVLAENLRTATVASAGLPSVACGWRCC